MKSVIILILLALGALALAGCRGIAASGEKETRRDVSAIAGELTNSAALPKLTADSSLSNWVAFALLNSPRTRAAFYQWSAAADKITVARSLPDPQITLQAYVQDYLTSLMPGFSWNIPGPGKLKARARVALAESQGKYFAFESAVFQTAFNLKRAYYQLGLLEEQLRLKRELVSLLADQERSARAQSVSGGASLAEWLRIESDHDRAASDVANLEDSRRAMMENFKAALGLSPDQPDPPMPDHFEFTAGIPDAAALREFAFAHNPDLKAMAADVRAAEAGIALAYKDRVPDFSLALMADVKASPILYWPQASMSLPIWRDKIAAEVAQARAGEMEAQAKLKSGQIDLAVSFAEKLFACRQTTRNLELLEKDLIPKTEQSLQTLRAGYRTGSADFAGLTETGQMLIELKLEAAQNRADREIALAELSLLVAGLPPANAPLLTHQP